MTTSDLVIRSAARWLNVNNVDLTDDRAVVLVLVEGRFTAAEIARYGTKATRLAIAMRVAGHGVAA